jgi:hypothetical protein
MTVAVTQRSTQEDGYTVAIVQPASMTADTLLEPTNPQVTIRTGPPSLAAERHYGRWSQTSYERHCTSLLQAIGAEGFTVAGTSRFARFDPPFKPWFLRRNEVVVDVQENRGSPGAWLLRMARKVPLSAVGQTRTAT